MNNRFKKLLIVSDCVHADSGDGIVVTDNQVFCRQMEALAACFEETIICCPFTHSQSFSRPVPYSLPNISFIRLPHVGGNGIADKIRIICAIPRWISAFRKGYGKGDIVYLRMPNNLSIPGFFYFVFRRAKKFSTYTGTWRNYPGEPLTYRFQKWLLKHFFHGPVWVYTDQYFGRRNFFANYSPSYTEAEWEEESERVDERIRKYRCGAACAPVFLTVGSLVPYKNQQYVLQVCKMLKDASFPFQWYIVGEGPLMETYRAYIRENDLGDTVYLTGRMNQGELRALYRRANFLVQPSVVEGYGKAPIEAMFHGVIPVLSEVPMAKEMTGMGRRGHVFSTADPGNLAHLVYNLDRNRELWPDLVLAGREYARDQTIENWSKYYIETIEKFFQPSR